MNMPGFTAEVSIYQSTQCYVMAPAVALARGDRVVLMAATFMPFMPSDGNGGGGCFPKGCSQCFNGFQECQLQNFPFCDTETRPCTSVGPCTCSNCSARSCFGGTCTTVPC